jgi:hypothetical protein
MTHRDIVVIGASAGGIPALTTLVAGLPPDFPASILVVVHISAIRHQPASGDPDPHWSTVGHSPGAGRGH